MVQLLIDAEAHVDTCHSDDIDGQNFDKILELALSVFLRCKGMMFQDFVGSFWKLAEFIFKFPCK